MGLFFSLMAFKDSAELNQNFFFFNLVKISYCVS